MSNPFGNSKRRLAVFVLIIGAIVVAQPRVPGAAKGTTHLFVAARPAANGQTSSSNNSGALVLTEATMCEEIKDGLPVNRSILFPMEKGRVLCFSTFENIPEQTTIFHKWYFRDKLIYRIKLALRPPRWSTYSNIKLRDTDRGPWRVEITDQQNHIYQILRFSVTD